MKNLSADELSLDQFHALVLALGHIKVACFFCYPKGDGSVFTVIVKGEIEPPEFEQIVQDVRSENQLSGVNFDDLE